MIIISRPEITRPYDSNLLTSQGVKFKNIGIQALQKNTFAVIILAGGQGTRLGTEDPKGCYVLPEIKKSLFEIHLLNIKNVMRLYNCKIQIIIMTSSYTHQKTMSYFEENEYFTLSRNLFTFVEQMDCMCFDFDDKPLLNKDGSFVMAPNGNGDVFRVLKDDKVYMKLPFLEYFNVISVDNVLAQVCDPIFLGFLIENDYDVVSKSITKRDNESVGVFIKRGENTLVKEYSEIMDCNFELRKNIGVTKLVDTKNEPPKIENNTKNKGDNKNVDNESTDVSIFDQGNICNHLFKRTFMEKMGGANLPVHKANKKIPCLDEKGNLTRPEKENGYKTELFIFDAFEFTTKCGVMNVVREFEFSPVKNSVDSDVDSPKTAVNDLYLRSVMWLEAKGAIIGDCNVLVMASKSVFGENLEEFNDVRFDKDTVIE